tara:strand:+ start:5993 stop:6367 length:375 start_codon:yes stop_codon:yes gene_type:complete
MRFFMEDGTETFPGGQGTDPHTLHRRDGSDTSAAAAYSIDPTHLEKMVYQVIRSFGESGCISDEVRAKLPHLSYSSVTARYRKLLDRNHIRDTGIRRPGNSGRGQRVMVARALDHPPPPEEEGS